MPALQVVVGADIDGLLVHTPVLWREGSAFNPRRSDVGDQPLHAIGTCPRSQLAFANATGFSPAGRNGIAISFRIRPP